MADLWYFLRNGQVEGPLPQARLLQMACDGQLELTAPVWPASGTQADARSASTILFESPGAAPAKPAWLADVAAPAKPTWLADVATAEKNAGAPTDAAPVPPPPLPTRSPAADRPPTGAVVPPPPPRPAEIKAASPPQKPRPSRETARAEGEPEPPTRAAAPAPSLPWPWVAGGAGLVLVLLLLLVLALAGVFTPSRKPVGDPDKDPGGNATTDQIRQVLERDVHVTGTATHGTHQEMLEGNRPWSCLRWQIDLSLVNGTPWDLELGKDFFLFEANADLSLYEGVVLFRGMGPRLQERVHLMPMDLGDPYGLSNNFQVHQTSGWYMMRRGNRTQTETVDLLLDGDKSQVVSNQADRPQFSAAPEDPRAGFGKLPARQTRRFQLTLDQGVTLADPSLRERVQIVLPDLVVTDRRTTERYRLIVQLRKLADSQNAWKVSGIDWVREDAGALAQVLESPEGNAITRICAANWLVELYPESAPEALVKVAQTLREGQLLISCLQLLSGTKGPGLEKHALRLLLDAKVSPNVRGWAGVYLGVLHHEPALAALTKAAGEANDVVAIGAIYGLGAFKAPAAETLLGLLNTCSPQRKTLVADNLVFTHAQSKDIFTGLWQLVAKDKDTEPGPTSRAALYALVKGGFPDTFEQLRKWADMEPKPKWRAALVQGLLQIDPEQASAIILMMLEKDEPPADDQLLEPDDLVGALRGWYTPSGMLGLQDLVQKGNLRAVQVLGGIPQEAAFVLLGGIARTGTLAQVFIALNALGQQWAKQSVSVFRDALKNPKPQIVQKAIEGLGNSGDPEAVKLLTPLKTSPDKDVRAAAEQALQRLKAAKPEP